MPAASARSVVSMSCGDGGVLRADLERQRRVGHPPLDLRGEVDAQHVAVDEHVVGRQAVQGGVVHGGAQHARVRHRAERRVVAQVDGVRAGRVDHLVRVGVQLLEGHPLAGDVTQGGQHARDELPGGAHLVDLRRVLEGHGSTLPRSGQATARGPDLRGGPAAKDEVAAPTGCGDCHGFARRSGWACGRIVCAIRPSTFGRLADSHLTRPGIEHVLDHLLPVSDDRTSGPSEAPRGFSQSGPVVHFVANAHVRVTACRCQVARPGVSRRGEMALTAPSFRIAAPGWYTDPSNPARQRWFDGTRWTARVQATPAPTAAAPAPPPRHHRTASLASAPAAVQATIPDFGAPSSSRRPRTTTPRTRPASARPAGTPPRGSRSWSRSSRCSACRSRRSPGSSWRSSGCGGPRRSSPPGASPPAGRERGGRWACRSSARSSARSW